MSQAPIVDVGTRFSWQASTFKHRDPLSNRHPGADSLGIPNGKSCIFPVPWTFLTITPKTSAFVNFCLKTLDLSSQVPRVSNFSGQKKKRSKKVPKKQRRKKLFDDPPFCKKKLLGFPGCCVLHFSRLRKPHSTTTVPVRSKGSVANGIPPSFDHWTPHQHLRCDFAMTEIDRGWLGICLGIWWNPSPFFLGRCVLAGGNLEGIFLEMACIVQIPSYNREQFGATH